jgi:glutamine amidotransferase-like uncharacterized protein
MRKYIGIFVHDPECSKECSNAISVALSKEHNIITFTVQDNLDLVLSQIDLIAFPGGIGDSDKYFELFHRRNANKIADWLDRGGKYLGICMGAYWAGKHYFDILNGIDAVQYIKRPNADIRRSYGTVANITWNNQDERMFFYDGNTFSGDLSTCEVVAKYSNGDPMAIIQNNIGLIGCHPESLSSWYTETFPYLKNEYHSGKHHELLLAFVNRL